MSWSFTENKNESEAISENRENKPERFSGLWKVTGKEVSFKREWSGVSFSDVQCIALLNGEIIEFEAISKKTGKPYKAKGALAEQEYSGRKYIGFQPDFMAAKPSEANPAEAPVQTSVQAPVSTPPKLINDEPKSTIGRSISSHDVFISHSSKDKQAADAICHSLESKNIKCWIAPRDVTPGFEYAEELIKGIKGSKLFLLIYSSHSNVSRPVSKEIESAFRYEKTVIPYRIENVQMRESLEYYLSNLHWLDAYPDDKEFDSLTMVIKNNLAAITSTASEPAVPTASSAPIPPPQTHIPSTKAFTPGASAGFTDGNKLNEISKWFQEFVKNTPGVKYSKERMYSGTYLKFTTDNFEKFFENFASSEGITGGYSAYFGVSLRAELIKIEPNMYTEYETSESERKKLYEKFKEITGLGKANPEKRHSGGSILSSKDVAPGAYTKEAITRETFEKMLCYALKKSVEWFGE